MPDITPLRLLITDPAKEEFKESANWLRGLPFDGAAAAVRLSEVIDRLLPELCVDLAYRLATGSNLPRTDEEASLAFARPAYRYTFTTAGGGKRKRRQTAGVWVLFYDFPDAKTLRVLALRHGAAQPLTAFLDESGGEP